MPRIPEVTERNSLPEDKRPIFDSIATSRGRVGFPFSLLLNCPEVAGRAAHLGAYLRFESTLPGADRELAIMTTAREMDCAYEWAAHVRVGRQEGVREEAIEVVANNRDPSVLNETEATVIRYMHALLREHRVGKELFDAALSRYGNEGIVELTAICGYYVMLACGLNAFEVPPPDGAEPLPKLS